MLQADANFQAANTRAVKTPVFKMTFADDPGANQFINITPVEDPDPVEPVVDPVSGTHVLLIAGTGAEAQYSDDGITWKRISVSDPTLSFYQASVAGGKLLLASENPYELWASDIGGAYALSKYWLTGADPNYTDRFPYPAAELNGTVYLNNEGEIQPSYRKFWTNTDLDTPWAELDGNHGHNLLSTGNRVLRFKYASYQQSTGGAFTDVSVPDYGTQRPMVHAMARCPDTGTLVFIGGDYYGAKRWFYSTDDGLSWTIGSGVDAPLNVPNYKPNILAIGAGCAVTCTPNGVLYRKSLSEILAMDDWPATYIEVEPFDDFNAITFDAHLGLFVAVGEGGRITTSPDGTIWTNRTAAGGYNGTFQAAIGGAF